MAAPPIPLLPPPPPLFPYTSPSLRHQVCGCVRWWRGRRGCVFHTATPPTSCQQLQAGGCLLVLVAEGEGGCVTFTGCPCGCSSPPLPHAVLFVGASMAHAAHTQPRHHHTCHGIVASLPILSSPLSVTARIPAAAAGGRRPDKHPHVMMMMTRAGVCHCVHHTSC